MNQKIRYDLVPQQGLEEVNKVLTKKLEKYQVHEWRSGMPWSQILSSLKKHLSNFEQGKDYTDDNTLSMAEVANNALILCELYHIYPHGDDRILNSVSYPRIALDVDDVCLDFKNTFEKRFNIQLNDYWDGSYQMQELLAQVINEKDFWVNMPVLHKPTFEPYCYITSRSIPTEWTMESLEKNGFPCAPVYSVPFNTSKVDLLKQLNIDILIDDKPNNYREACSNGIFCYLMDAAHNRFVHCGHRRIFNLNLQF